MHALNGIRVVEWGGGFIAAAYAAHLLRELGAEVVKVEPVAGDLARHYGPFPQNRPDPDASGLFIALNAGKKSVALDIDTAEGLAALQSLVASADVLISDVALARRRRLRMDPLALRAVHPQLITVGLSVFGETGPLALAPQAAVDACAVSGASHVLGERGREPLSLPFDQPDFQAGVHGAGGALMALIARSQSGKGQNVDIASADVLAAAIGTNSMTFRHFGSLSWEREGRRASGSGGAYPYTILPCKDGLVCVMGRSKIEWQRFVEALGNPQWAEEPRYQDLKAMGTSYPDEVDALLIPWLSRYTREELSAIGSRFNFPIGPLKTIDEVIASPQLRHRGYFREIPHATLGSVKVPGVPWQVAGVPRSPVGPAPRLGEHTAELLAQLVLAPGSTLEAAQAKAATPDSAVTPAAQRTAASQYADRHAAPLAGLRVLDFGWVWSGPVVSTLLAEFGAEVIKVEHAGRLDNMRLRGVPTIDGRKPEGPAIEVNPYFNQINHGKGSITVNLKDVRGQALLHRLIPLTDVVIENLTPGALAKSGFGYSTLSKLNPQLVMMSMSSTGQHGPLNQFRAYAPIMSSHCGLENLIGYPGEPPLGMLNFGYGDPNAAAHALLPLLAALIQRKANGQGCYIDMSQTEAVVSVLIEPIMRWTMNHEISKPAGNRHAYFAPHGIFPAAGKDQWLSIAVPDDSAWNALIDLMLRPVWALDTALSTAPGRRAAADRIEPALAAWTQIQNRGLLVEQLRSVGIAASPVLTVEQQWTNQQFLARDLRIAARHPYLGTQDIYRTPWTMSETPPRVRGPAPLLGSDNERVFGGLLGLPSSEIAWLQSEGVIA